MSTSSKQHLRVLFPLFLVIFIDTMGAGLLFPILEPLVVDPVSSILPDATGFTARQTWFGIVMSAYMLMMFISAPIVGDWSDHVGRKKALLFCLIMTCIGYLLSAQGVANHMIIILLIGRAVDGLSASSEAISQATILDISSREEKSINLGLIILAASTGFTMGPLCGGLLSDPEVVTWFNWTTPLYFAACLAVFNSLLLLVTFKDPKPKANKVFKINFKRCVELLTDAFKIKEIRKLSVIFFFHELGWAIYIQFIPVFLFKKFGFTSHDIAMFMVILALGYAFGSSILNRIVNRFLSAKTIIILGLALVALGYYITYSYNDILLIKSAVILLTAGGAISYAAILTMYSNQVSEDRQGWIMGVTGSVTAFAFCLTGLSGNVLGIYNINLPLVVATVVTFVAIGYALAIKEA